MLAADAGAAAASTAARRIHPGFDVAAAQGVEGGEEEVNGWEGERGSRGQQERDLQTRIQRRWEIGSRNVKQIGEGVRTHSSTVENS